MLAVAAGRRGANSLDTFRGRELGLRKVIAITWCFLLQGWNKRMPNSVVEDVECRAKNALAHSPIYELKELQVEHVDDSLLISGRVGSFYHKQLAQELVLAVVREVQIVNQIEVD